MKLGWKFVAGLIALGGLLAAHPASAQQMFKCGGTFQDRPCADQDEQKRFSHAAGTFSINQVNGDTDKDCASMAAELHKYWLRMDAGEPLEALKAEVDAKPISRFDKSRMRDVLIGIREYRGSPKQVRSELESRCMAAKRTGSESATVTSRGRRRH